MPIEENSLKTIAEGCPSPLVFLRAVQARFNWVPPLALEVGAEYFKISFLKVYEMAAFTPGLSLEERGEIVFEVCQGLACREAGSDQILRFLEASTGLRVGETSPDGRLTLCRQSCFGRCAIGPNIRVQGHFDSNQSPDSAADLLRSALENLKNH